MKHARVLVDGKVQRATEREGRLLLEDGRLMDEAAVTWLPPVAPPADRPRTILALGLNYADHASELAFKAPEEPLAFLKGENTLNGHRGFTRRPAGVNFKHASYSSTAAARTVATRPLLHGIAAGTAAGMNPAAHPAATPSISMANPTPRAVARLICPDGNGRNGRSWQSTSTSNTSFRTMPAV